MEKFPNLYDIAERLYEKLELLINSMIKEASLVSEDFDKKEVMIGLDHYIQAILVNVSIADKKLDEYEISYFKKIAKYDDLLKDFVLQDNVLTKDLEMKLKKISDDILEVIPSFIELSVICDKRRESLCSNLNPTYCQQIYDYLIRIANYLKFVDGEVVSSEDKTARESIKYVRAYYLKKYVTFAPKRKK